MHVDIASISFGENFQAGTFGATAPTDPSLAPSLLRPTRSRAIRFSTKFGAIACAAGTLAAIGHDLPDDYRWASGVAFLILAVAVAIA